MQSTPTTNCQRGLQFQNPLIFRNHELDFEKRDFLRDFSIQTGLFFSPPFRIYVYQIQQVKRALKIFEISSWSLSLRILINWTQRILKPKKTSVNDVETFDMTHANEF